MRAENKISKILIFLKKWIFVQNTSKMKVKILG
jgi:hypothetical protein